MLAVWLGVWLGEPVWVGVWLGSATPAMVTVFTHHWPADAKVVEVPVNPTGPGGMNMRMVRHTAPELPASPGLAATVLVRSSVTEENSVVVPALGLAATAVVDDCTGMASGDSGVNAVLTPCVKPTMLNREDAAAPRSRT